MNWDVPIVGMQTDPLMSQYKLVQKLDINIICPHDNIDR